jgi:hypothetical protein
MFGSLSKKGGGNNGLRIVGKRGTAVTTTSEERELG